MDILKQDIAHSAAKVKSNLKLGHGMQSVDKLTNKSNQKQWEVATFNHCRRPALFQVDI